MPMTPSSEPRPGDDPDTADCPATRREFVKTSARTLGAGPAPDFTTSSIIRVLDTA